MKIEISNLSKIYGKDFRALNKVDLTIKDGMFGLLGPNGAGKTTLMSILVTLVKPSHGNVLINEYDLFKHRREIRSMLGYLPQDFSVFSRLTTWEFLEYGAALAGIKNSSERKNAVEDMLDRVGLFEARDRKANKLSGGMKRRLGIAQALIGNPQILVVDEPTTGLDPEERIKFRNILTDLGQNNVIIILSTHIVGDISSSCQDMALLDEGKIVFNGAPTELIKLAEGHVWMVECDERTLESIKEEHPVISTIPSKVGYEVRLISDSSDGLNGKPVEPNLEDAYLYFMHQN